MSPKLAELLQQAETLPPADQLKLIAHLAQNLSAGSHPETVVDDGQPEKTTGESLLEMFDSLIAEIPKEELANLPSDGAEQHDHYLYGAPKRYE